MFILNYFTFNNILKSMKQAETKPNVSVNYSFLSMQKILEFCVFMTQDTKPVPVLLKSTKLSMRVQHFKPLLWLTHKDNVP